MLAFLFVNMNENTSGWRLSFSAFNHSKSFHIERLESLPVPIPIRIYCNRINQVIWKKTRLNKSCQ